MWDLGAGMCVTAGGHGRGTGKVGEGDRESAMFGMQLRSLHCSASLCHSYITFNHQNYSLHIFSEFVLITCFFLFLFFFASDVQELNTRRPKTRLFFQLMSGKPDI